MYLHTRINAEPTTIAHVNRGTEQVHEYKMTDRQTDDAQGHHKLPSSI